MNITINPIPTVWDGEEQNATPRHRIKVGLFYLAPVGFTTEQDKALLFTDAQMLEKKTELEKFKQKFSIETIK